MAHYVPTDGFENFTGALSNKKIQGVHHMTVTRRKRVKDPLTGEVVGFGPKEIFSQNHRDYNENPLTQGETKQRGKWSQACREAPLICRDKNHPRFMEMYERWRAQLSSNEPCKQFPNFVRAVLASEKSPN